jgi:3-oxoadipate enol-lactonase
MSSQGPFASLRHAAADDGRSIAFAVAPGRSGAPRVVLLHSLALDRTYWDRIAQAAEGGLELLALDICGHGASPAPGPFTIARMADDAAAVMDAVGWDRAIVAGCSMGGCVALGMAVRHPARVAALMAIDTTAWYGPTAAQDWAQRADRAREGGMAALLPFQRARWLSPAFLAAHPEVQAGQEGVFLRMDVESYGATCAMLGAMDQREDVVRITVPTAVLVGEEDGATPPAMARDIAARIGGASLTILPGARHLTPLERPQEVVSALLALAGRVKRNS